MRLYILPRDKQGIWSAALTAAFIVLIALKIRGAMPLSTFAIAALGLAGFFLGIYAVVDRQNRSILTFLSVPTGLLIIVWIVAEIIFTH